VPRRDDARATLEALIDEAQIAEAAGFHSVVAPHRHGRTENYFPGPLQLLTVLARETDRVALGTFSLITTLVHPMSVAEQASIIDNLSGGRLFLTLGRGFNPEYWNYFGAPQDRLLGRHLEAVRLIKQAYEGERFTFDGEFYDVVDSVLTPQPFQTDGIPIWAGGDSDPAVRRAADWGVAWASSPFPLNQERWDDLVGTYRAKTEAKGAKPFVVLCRDGWVAQTNGEAGRTFGEHYVADMRYYHRQGILQNPDYPTPESVTVDSIRDHVVMGDPARCIEQLEMFEANFGVDYFVLRCRMPTGPSLEANREQIQMMGEEVVSYFHKRDPEPQLHPAIPEGARW
jgi:alkanesulfonate monooxygenase SsuD/methylene tetrahydromethanopterin reductase-like flavin-dependent oxidoreductase (luciferase family)